MAARSFPSNHLVRYRGTRLGGSIGVLDWGARFGSLRCTNSTGLPGGLMHLFRFCLAAFNGGVCGAAAAVGFIIRRPQTSLGAARPTLRATTGAVSREKLLSRKHTDAPRHTHWTSSNPPASTSSPYPGGNNPWIPNVTEHISPHITSERQTPDTALDPRCQSGPQPEIHSTLVRQDFSNNYGADQQRLQISDLHFDKFLNPATLA